MSLRGWIKEVVGSHNDAITTGALRLYECRHCGTTLAPETEICPVCHSTEIAFYEL